MGHMLTPLQQTFLGVAKQVSPVCSMLSSVDATIRQKICLDIPVTSQECSVMYARVLQMSLPYCISFNRKLACLQERDIYALAGYLSRETTRVKV